MSLPQRRLSRGDLQHAYVKIPVEYLARAVEACRSSWSEDDVLGYLLEAVAQDQLMRSTKRPYEMKRDEKSRGNNWR